MGNCISNSPSDYLGDNTGLTNVCTSIVAAGRKGCDACDICNGPGYPYYTDGDGDGWGELGSTANSCTSAGNANNNSDLDDTCDCYANTTAALAAGGSCVDNTGVCGGSQYTASCSDIEYIMINYPDDGKCPGMGCDGSVNGTATVGWYLYDADGDGLGGPTDAGWLCSSDASVQNGSVVENTTDFDDSCACTTSQGNTLAACYDCLGNCISSASYFGGNTGLTNTCTSGELVGRKGCDICDICNGPGYPYYTDADSDGW